MKNFNGHIATNICALFLLAESSVFAQEASSANAQENQFFSSATTEQDMFGNQIKHKERKKLSNLNLGTRENKKHKNALINYMQTGQQENKKKERQSLTPDIGQGDAAFNSVLPQTASNNKAAEKVSATLEEQIEAQSENVSEQIKKLEDVASDEESQQKLNKVIEALEGNSKSKETSKEGYGF